MHSTRTAHRAGGFVRSTQQRRLLEATVQKLLDVQRQICPTSTKTVLQDNGQTTCEVAQIALDEAHTHGVPHIVWQDTGCRDLHEVPSTSLLATCSCTTHSGEDSKTTKSGRVQQTSPVEATASNPHLRVGTRTSPSPSHAALRGVNVAREPLPVRGECRSISQTHLRCTVGQATGKPTVDGTGDLVRWLCGPARCLRVQHLPLSFVPVPAREEGRARPCMSSTSGKVTVSSGVLGEAQLSRRSRVHPSGSLLVPYLGVLEDIPRAPSERGERGEARRTDLQRATSMRSYARPADLRVEAHK
ncbi:hypothetical protein VTO73DRAFT_12314 [Trametes versicolor]